MNKLNYLFIITILVFNSCAKQEIEQDDAFHSTNTIKYGTDFVPDFSDCLANVSVINGLLKFESRSDLNNTIVCLQEKTHLMDSLSILIRLRIFI